ncbi:Crp/Fnr family transcriptional regulator [Streptomyces sp. C10-9-1]|uniref:Crp/Fnr family transcriptional regulator n=1 Tax=Streptomyces sp. C10-9-1 TaxID=1859285 RepID=UPI002112E233|nr:Crp/Fnr family transcriptional regulator [Streptomyces sp. C10-9-1]MCQ6552243.1 Crp/Fnr family transcriptional regulator [Streptomyces sp. C10-9-1]
MITSVRRAGSGAIPCTDDSPAAPGIPASAPGEERDFPTRVAHRIAASDGSLPTVSIARGQHVYNCTQPDRNLYLVKTGQVKTVAMTASGKRCLLDLSMPGDLFGEMCLARSCRDETAVAMSNTTLTRISQDLFFATLQAENLFEAFTLHLAGKLSEQQRIIADLVTMESELRLVSRLLQLSRRLGEEHHQGVVISARLTQEELAEMIGTTRSRVGFFLKRLRAAGLITCNRGYITIRSVSRLASFVEERMALDGP